MMKYSIFLKRLTINIISSRSANWNKMLNVPHMAPGPQFSHACAGWPAVKVGGKKYPLQPRYGLSLVLCWPSPAADRGSGRHSASGRRLVYAPSAGICTLSDVFSHDLCDFPLHLNQMVWSRTSQHRWMLKSQLLKPWGLYFCQRGRDAERGVADGTARPVVKQISALGLCNVKVWARALAGGVEVSDFKTTIISKVGFYVYLCMIMQLRVDVKKVVTGREERRAACFIFTDAVLSCISCFLRQHEQPQRCLLCACGWRELSSCWIAYGTLSAHFACSAAQLPSERTSVCALQGRRRLTPCQEWDSSQARGRFPQGISTQWVC